MKKTAVWLVIVVIELVLIAILNPGLYLAGYHLLLQLLPHAAG